MKPTQSRFITMFESKDISLLQMLEQIHTGQVQIPDLQRRYQWSSSLVSSLIGTICSGLPIGCLLILECGRSSPKFLPRPLDSVTLDAPIEPSTLVLDGQQRLTTLHALFYSQDPLKILSKTKRKAEYSWYYLDILK